MTSYFNLAFPCSTFLTIARANRLLQICYHLKPIYGVSNYTGSMLHGRINNKYLSPFLELLASYIVIAVWICSSVNVELTSHTRGFLTYSCKIFQSECYASF
ncbi:hypothetical protein F4814DRAFT_117234 [Daldinia grandis]|nr:hypothetical protein F4814DRAFT_117234 [Daldinia grandis]